MARSRFWSRVGRLSHALFRRLFGLRVSANRIAFGLSVYKPSDCFDYTRSLPPPSGTPGPTPTPTPTPTAAHTAHLLTEIADAATRASDRIAAAACATTDSAVKDELRDAAMDIERVTKLATGGS